MRLPAARPIPIATTTTGLLVAGGLTLIVGWAFLETTGAASAQVNLWNGTSNVGALVAPISLSSGQSTRDLIPAPFLACESGLFVEVASGSIRGSVWTIEATMIDGFAFADGAIPWPSGEL